MIHPFPHPSHSHGYNHWQRSCHLILRLLQLFSPSISTSCPSYQLNCHCLQKWWPPITPSHLNHTHTHTHTLPTIWVQKPSEWNLYYSPKQIPSVVTPVSVPWFCLDLSLTLCTLFLQKYTSLITLIKSPPYSSYPNPNFLFFIKLPLTTTQHGDVSYLLPSVYKSHVVLII